MTVARTLLAVLLAAALASPAAAQPELPVADHFTVRRVQASPSTEERQVTLLMRVSAPGARPAFWVAERRLSWRRMKERGVRHEWIDGRSCAPLSRVLSSIDKLPPMAFGGVDAEAPIARFHVPVTTLFGPPANRSAAGGYRISRSDYEGGVSAWWSRSETLIAACWQATSPAVQGVPVAPRLDSDEKAELLGRPYW